ncbi:hypothetical protein EMCRGX_G031156 [Ephydatia muelleri]
MEGQRASDAASRGSSTVSTTFMQCAANQSHPFAANGNEIESSNDDSCTVPEADGQKPTLKEMSTSEKELKLSLYLHISNPFTRLTKYRQFPVKFAVHLFKSFCILTQVILFINSPSGMQSAFKSEAQKVFSALLVHPDVLSSTGGRLAPSTVYTAYRIQEVKAALDFAGFRFGNFTSIVQGHQYARDSNGSPLPIEVALTEYASDKLDIAEKSYVFNAQKNTSYFFLNPETGIGIVEQLNNQCADNCLERFLTLDVTFRANDIRVKQPTIVQCYNVTSRLQFIASNGRILHTYTVNADLKCMNCQNYIKTVNSSGNFKIILGFRVAVGLIVFANLSYDAEGVRILLGIGIILQAVVILRYVSYFSQFNVLSRALEIAFPRLFKYIVFVTILYIAFMLFGWILLSPFHSKFSSIDETFYTLFTMLNGDDLYNTFVGFNMAENAPVYIFGQAYFTTFMALFIYAILNLFVSLIVEARKDSQNIHPLMKNEVTRFVYSGPLTAEGVALRDLGLVQQNMYVKPEVILRRDANGSDN